VDFARDAHARAAECPSPASFDAAYAQSAKPRGFERNRAQRDRARRARVDARPPRTGPPWPPPRRAAAGGDVRSRGWCRRKTLVLLGFVATVLLAAGAVTALALHPPLFGPLSTAGGALGLRFFCWCSRRAPPRAMRRASMPSLLARQLGQAGQRGPGRPRVAAARDDDA